MEHQPGGDSGVRRKVWKCEQGLKITSNYAYGDISSSSGIE